MFYKHTFCDIFRTVITIRDGVDKMCDILNASLDNCFLSDAECKLLDVLVNGFFEDTTIVDDDVYDNVGNLVTYYVYDCYYDKKSTKKVLSVDGKPIEINSCDELYDFIVEYLDNKDNKCYKFKIW